ncbi:MAG: hypothetical protein RL307_1542 [Pseudomonadota bacterium]|jgi:pimeloyl-ACP methyl ester carboxylesterase
MPLIGQLRAMSLLKAQIGADWISYRQAGQGPALVLLHGIGSASGSWLHQLMTPPGHQQVLAWDAPGYGHSSALPMDQPTAEDYAKRMWQWLDAVTIHASPVTLVGHSLGALMAAAAAGLRPQSVKRLILLSPAQGYGHASVERRESKLKDRLSMLERLGPEGLARERGKAMLSPRALAEQISHVQHLMSAIDPRGYTQAARMLAHDDLKSRLAIVSCPTVVASGQADTITPPEGCIQLAQSLGLPYVSLGEVGHACAIEAADAVSALLSGSAS